MPNSSEHQQAVVSIREYHLPQMLNADAASREYAQLALRSVITMNAGVAVAYPAIAEVFISDTSFSTVVWPTGIAVLGTVLGILCAYFVYFNHGYEANEHFSKMELEVVKADEFFDQKTYWRFQKYRIETKEHWEKWEERYGNRRNVTFYCANIVGVSSLICFAVSVFWFALSISSHTV